MAAIATFALKPGVWFRRVRLVIVSPDSQRTACLLSGRNSTYRPVQISGTSSESFVPTKDFDPGKPYQTRLIWRGLDGINRFKLLLTKPEMVIAIALRGETEPGGERKARPPRPAQPRAPRKRPIPRAEA